MHLLTVKKLYICLLTRCSGIVFILLVNIINHTFKLFINNIVRKHIIDEVLFYVFYIFMKYCFGGGYQFGMRYQVINNCFFISEGAFTYKVDITGVVNRSFSVSRGSEVIVVSIMK